MRARSGWQSLLKNKRISCSRAFCIRFCISPSFRNCTASVQENMLLKSTVAGLPAPQIPPRRRERNRCHRASHAHLPLPEALPCRDPWDLTLSATSYSKPSNRNRNHIIISFSRHCCLDYEAFGIRSWIALQVEIRLRTILPHDQLNPRV